MLKKIHQTAMIATAVSLYVGAVSMHNVALADAATTTFPNYSFNVDESSDSVAEMAVMEVMHETSKSDPQANARAFTTTTFPNFAVTEPVPQVSHPNLGPIAPRKQGFSPWVQTTP